MLISASVITTQLLIPGTALAAGTTTTDRIAGTDRYDTSVKIAQKNWTTSDYAVIARGDDFADALSSGPLAKAYGAPVLLTQTDNLSQKTLDEIVSLKVKTVFIAGGVGAVSAKTEQALKDKNIVVQRFAGTDRFNTSELIAAQVLAKLGKVSGVAIATGLNYPDALSIAPIASSQGFPIILTNGKTISDSAKSFITDNGLTTPYIIGGTGAMLPSLETAIDGLSINGASVKAIRLSGNDRYDTNAQVVKHFAGVLDFSNIYLAVGDGLTSADGFPDALSASALAGALNAPIVLGYKQLSASVTDLLSKYAKANTVITAIGGISAIPDTILTTADKSRDTKAVVPEVSDVSLTDQDGKAINGVISGNKIVFTLPTTSTNIMSGSAKLNEDVASASFVQGAISVDKNDGLKTTDDFLAMILKAAQDKGFNTADGVSISGIKKYLNNSTIKFTDANGFVRIYTIEIQ